MIYETTKTLSVTVYFDAIRASNKPEASYRSWGIYLIP